MGRMSRRELAFVASIVAGFSIAGCASAPPAVVPVVAPVPLPSLDTKIAWILRLENQRMLRDGVLPPLAAGGANPSASLLVRPATTPDLADLAADVDPSVRRRSAMAIGRIKDPAGLPLLVSALQDPTPEVRAMAAFGLGLVADARGVRPLVAALADSTPRARACHRGSWTHR